MEITNDNFFITAEKAHAIAIEAEKKRIKQQQTDIFTRIQTDAANGKFETIHFGILYPETLEFLEQQGFKVEVGYYNNVTTSSTSSVTQVYIRW